MQITVARKQRHINSTHSVADTPRQTLADQVTLAKHMCCLLQPHTLPLIATSCSKQAHLHAAAEVAIGREGVRELLQQPASLQVDSQARLGG